MQYWINHNGVQSGPVDIDGLKDLALTSRAYVWHEGMTDWVKITEVPELQGLYEVVADDAEVETPPIPPVEPVAQEPQPEAAVPEEAVVGTPYRSAEPQGEAAIQQPQQAVWPQDGAAAAPVQPAAKCPPTNLAWAIFSTICCCLPAGVVSIIYAVKVTNKFNAGDLEGAERASEISAWWCIASFVLGIISLPFGYLLPLLGAE